MSKLEPVTPSEILVNEFIKPLNISINQFIKINELDKEYVLKFIDNQVEIDANFATELSKIFGNSVQFWLNLRNNYNRRVV